MLETLKQKFNLPTITLLRGRDKYGELTTIKEFDLTAYTKDLDIAIEQLINSVDYALSDDALSTLKDMSIRDNTFNEFLGYKKYTIERIHLLKNNWFGVVIKFDDGTTRNVVETGLSYALHNKKNMAQYVSGGKHYFTAGGLNDDEVDFIFHGVGHSSKSQLYEFDTDDIIL